jgi:hypothetical protein
MSDEREMATEGMRPSTTPPFHITEKAHWKETGWVGINDVENRSIAVVYDKQDALGIVAQLNAITRLTAQLAASKAECERLRGDRDAYAREVFRLRDELAALRADAEANKRAMGEALKLLKATGWESDLNESGIPNGGLSCRHCNGGMPKVARRIDPRQKPVATHAAGCWLAETLSALAARIGEVG